MCLASRAIRRGPALAVWSEGVFEFRNEVAHGACEPRPDQAEQVLRRTREIIEHIRERECEVVGRARSLRLRSIRRPPELRQRRQPVPRNRMETTLSGRDRMGAGQTPALWSHSRARSASRSGPGDAVAGVRDELQAPGP